MRDDDRRAGRHRPALALTSDPGTTLLAVRLAEAGADVLWRWDDVGVADLVAAVQVDRLPRSLDEPLLKRSAGVAPTGQVNAFLDALVEQGLLRAFLPGTTQQGSGLPRRRSMAVRRLAAELGGVQPTSTAGRAALEIPSWRDVRRFVQGATGLSARGEALATP
jgi:hypothetical protein